MKSIEIKSNNRANTGKTSTNSLRKEGNVPCVLYGGNEVVHFSAKEIGFKKTSLYSCCSHCCIRLWG